MKFSINKMKMMIIAGVWLMLTGGVDGQPVPPQSLTYQVRLPLAVRPFPEPFAAGQHPGFKFRGTKGWAWTPEQYLEEIPWLTRFKLNFLMNCYVSLFSSTQPWKNEWWKPLPNAEKAAYSRVIRTCQTNGIIFCFCMNPQLASKRPLDPDNPGDIALFYKHYAWAQSQGVKWFSICVDDVNWGNKEPVEVAAGDVKIVNAIFGHLREKDPEAQMIFCPGIYHGDGSNVRDHAYLATLGRELNPDTYVFWTGDGVRTPHMTRWAAESFKKAVNHRLFLWDNYPVNDGLPTLSLGPVSGRPPDLGDVVDGYMSNPMATQNQINRLPLATCADYAWNPQAYDPARSIGQAILLLGKTEAQKEVLKEMVEAYPGFLFTGGGPGTNPVREQFKKLAGQPGSQTAARQLLQQIEDLSTRLTKEFPREFGAAKKTVANDVAWMKSQS
jgi:hyaluronoglucosaminidase